ncbi:MAG: hypothetical protein WC076_12560, partial [Terrimicrobiaceae bacterium]
MPPLTGRPYGKRLMSPLRNPEMPVRTSSKGEGLEAAAIAGRYKSLSLAENAFRSLKTVDLKVRPIHHRNADRAR